MKRIDLGCGVYQDESNLAYFKVDLNYGVTTGEPKTFVTVRPVNGKIISDYDISEEQKAIMLQSMGIAPRNRSKSEMLKMKADKEEHGIEPGENVLFAPTTPDVAYQQFMENKEIQEKVLNSPIVKDMIRDQIQEAMKFYMGAKEGEKNEPDVTDAGNAGNGPAGVGAAGSEDSGEKPKAGANGEKGAKSSSKTGSTKSDK